MRRRRWWALLVALLPLAAHTDDTDIYTSSLLPANSVPLVMFSLDLSTAANAVYGGCNLVGSGATMCAPAQYFQANCSSCVLPAATAPLTYLHAIRYAMHIVLGQQSGMKVGLMLNHNQQSSCEGPRPALPTLAQKCSNGAYIARGFKLLDRVTVPGNPLLGIPDTTVTGANTNELFTILDALQVPTVATAHSYQGKELMFEFFRYLTGQAIYNGHNGYTDYGTTNLLNLNADNPSFDWDSSIEAAGLYLTPIGSDMSCAKIFTVNFILSNNAQDSDSDAAIDSDLAGGMIGLNLSSPNDRLEDVLGYLHDVDLARASLPFGTVPALTGTQNVTSYFFTQATGAGPTFDANSTAYATQGGTTRPLEVSSDPATLVQNLQGALTQVLSVSTSFVAASVPVNVFNRTQVLNDVYTALFQPDIAAKPFWSGNVKKLKTQIFDVPCPTPVPAGCTPSKRVALVDANGNEAVEIDGRIRNDALTFWTDGSTIAASAAAGVQAGKDGRHVTLGGAGQRIPGYLTAAPGLTNASLNARQMWLYPGTGGSLVALNADASTAASYTSPLGAVDATEALRVLKVIRGYDEYDSDGDLNKTEVRPWLMADPLHSRPLAINYGAFGGHTASNPAIYIAVATNDGLLHLINNTTGAGAESGAEAWAFMPFDLLGIQKALAVNVPVAHRTYGLDGSPVVWVKDVDRDGTIEPSDGDRVYLYVGMRRGGRAYYALNITDPAVPTFLWRITPSARATSAGDVATTDFAQMGLTFSTPQLARVKTGTDVSGNPIIKQVLVFGGGYDAAANDYTAATLAAYTAGLASTGSTNGDDTMGNAIFMVDAETGALVWKAVGPVGGVLPAASATLYPHALMKDSIPSNVSVVDTNADGLADRIVVGDTGGNVWRVDLGDDRDSPADRNATDDWKPVLLAKLGRAYGSGRANDRRFFHEPDYVLSQDEIGPFDAIVIGSGDREDPLDYGRVRTLSPTTDTYPQNAFYVIKDRRIATYSRDDSDTTTILTPASLADVSDNCTQDLSILRTSCTPDFANGWYIRLTGSGNGEKVLAGALTAANRIFFTSYVPPQAASGATCGPSEGTGQFYAVGLKKGTAVFNFNTSDGGSTSSPNSALDRREAMASSGIPAEVVYVNLPDGAGGEVKCLLSSDLNCRSMPGATRFRTFWYRDE